MTDPSLYYLPDGRHICQICCEAKDRDELTPVTGEPGKVWDVCKECAEIETSFGGGPW